MKHVETGTSSPIRILVTGFGAFPGAPRNPTLAILDRLEGARARLSRLGIAIATLRLPVVFDAVGPLTASAASDGADAILHLGLAGRRKQISVETRALNRAGPLHPDASGRCPRQVIAPGGSHRLRASYPADRVVAAIRARGLIAQRSIDAGDYVCNRALYETLARGLAPVAGFLHVPKTRRCALPLRSAATRRPSLDDLVEAVVATLILLGREARRGSRRLGGSGLELSPGCSGELTRQDLDHRRDPSGA